MFSGYGVGLNTSHLLQTRCGSVSVSTARRAGIGCRVSYIYWNVFVWFSKCVLILNFLLGKIGGVIEVWELSLKFEDILPALAFHVLYFWHLYSNCSVINSYCECFLYYKVLSWFGSYLAKSKPSLRKDPNDVYVLKKILTVCVQKIICKIKWQKMSLR